MIGKYDWDWYEDDPGVRLKDIGDLYKWSPRTGAGVLKWLEDTAKGEKLGIIIYNIDVPIWYKCV